MCQYCNVKSSFRRSQRQHRRPPREFFTCSNCGETVQGIERNGKVHEIRVRKQNPSKVMPVRVPIDEWHEWKMSGLTARKFIESKAPK